MKYKLAYILIILFTLNLRAQENNEWTLERCINHALEQNIALKIQQNMEKKAVYDRQQSQWNLAPTVNGWGESNFDFRRSTNQNNEISSGSTCTMSYGISSSMNLFSGFTTMNSISANRFNELVCAESSKLAINLLTTEVTDLFARVVYQQALTEVAREQLEVSISELKRITATIEAGQLEQAALNEIEATVSGNRLVLSQAENEFRLLKLKLAQLIEIPENTNFNLLSAEIDTKVPDEKNQSIEYVYATACMNYPAILQKEYELEYFRKLLHISKGHLAPSLSLNGGYSSGFYSTDTLPDGSRTPFNTQFNNYLNPSVGLTLKVPVLNGRYRDFQVKKSKIDLENAMFKLENEKKMIRREIEDALMKKEAYYIEYQHAGDNLKYAEKSFETYREKFRLGLINTTDFMNAQSQLSKAKSEVLRAKYSWYVTDKTIQLYQGLNQ